MDGSGCPFWYWEEDYIKVLEQKRILGHGGRMQAQVKLVAALWAGLDCRQKEVKVAKMW